MGVSFHEMGVAWCVVCGVHVTGLVCVTCVVCM